MGAIERSTATDWFTSFTWVTLELARAVAAERWQAIGLPAMLPTLVSQTAPVPPPPPAVPVPPPRVIRSNCSAPPSPKDEDIDDHQNPRVVLGLRRSEWHWVIQAAFAR